MISKIKSFLNQPYPEDKGVKSYLLGCFWIAVFIGLFLYIFAPFGMNKAGEMKAYYSFMFGLITFVVSFGFDLSVRYVLGIHRDTERWVFWKWMVHVLIIMILISAANYVYMWIEFDLDLSLGGFGYALMVTFLVGIIPVFFVGLLNSQRATLKNQKVAQTLNYTLQAPTGNKVNLAALDSKESFELDPARILFIEAMQNYIVVHYDNGESPDQKIIRNTLGAVENVLQGSSLQRSHRSYLVNRNRIEHVEGNAQGLRLTLSGAAHKQIPVSRKYIPNFQ